jgi:hypothetical protein
VLVGALGAGVSVGVGTALEVVAVEPLAAVLACPGVVAARTAKAPVVSAAAAALALVIVTMRRRASVRWALDEAARVGCGVSS